jgi:hypothetical protein
LLTLYFIVVSAFIKGIMLFEPTWGRSDFFRVSSVLDFVQSLADVRSPWSFLL